MQAAFFTASPGENFSFISDDGIQWSGTCLELRLANEGPTQFRGLVRGAQEDRFDTEVQGHYNPKTGVLDFTTQ